MIDKYLDKMLQGLSKTGKAVLVFKVAKYPGDTIFDQEPPHIDLYIIPSVDEEYKKDEINKEVSQSTEKISDSYFLGTISNDMQSEERSFIFTVESLYGIFHRFFKNKPKRTSLQVTIIAEPHGPWKEYYERTDYKMKLKSGQPIPLTVALKPKVKTTLLQKKKITK